ncbi:MAG: transglycosylase domain-containing protein [Chloroflexi bacterium]|nr:transglycosylase domain-containing protein [Chloroflexota bacterium]
MNMEDTETDVSGEPAPAHPAAIATPGRKSTRRRLLRWGSISAGLLVIAAVALWGLSPSVSDLESRVATLAALRGTPVLRPGDVPTLLAEAIVATEDERFYQHHGIDVIGLSRALLYDVAHLCACQGGSTITQQLAKDLYLNGSDGGFTKLVDIALAFKVELQPTKQRILADYLTEVPSGYGLHGMPEAACAYFHRPLRALDLGQIAVLAGMPQAPSAYDPRFHPVAAATRRAAVLASMVSEGYVTPQQAATAAAEPVVAAAMPGGC